MPQRMEIELTSQTGDGGYTWRAAGARQPRGSVESSVVPTGAQVGDVLRAEVENGIEGIEIVALQPVKVAETRRSPETIEVLGPPRRSADVSVSLTGGRNRRRQTDQPERRRPGERPRREAPASRRGDGRPRGEAGSEGSRRDTGRRGRSEDGRAPGGRDRRPAVSTAHRNAALAALRPEEVPVAEELLRGGLPAVRAAIEQQNTRAEKEGRPTVSAEPLLATAERLVPVVNLASWKDRATAAQSAGRELRLRELRAVVAASRTVVLDEEGRTMARALGESLEHRVGALRQDWLNRLTRALEKGRLLEALEASARVPDPTMRLPAELADQLVKAASAALAADLEASEWSALLDAVVASPVRRRVRPAGIPDDEAARAAALRAAGLVPDLARQLGLPLPPPPPRRSPVSERPAGRRRSPGGAAPATAS